MRAFRLLAAGLLVLAAGCAPSASTHPIAVRPAAAVIRPAAAVVDTGTLNGRRTASRSPPGGTAGW